MADCHLWLIAIMPSICANTFSSSFELELCYQPVVYKGCYILMLVDTHNEILNFMYQDA